MTADDRDCEEAMADSLIGHIFETNATASSFQHARIGEVPF
jgi:hypothetical protein